MEREIAVAGRAVAPGWALAWEAAETGSVPRAGLAAGPPHALWFLALWHLLMVWIWAWSCGENEAVDREEGGGWAASEAVRGAACGAGVEAEAAPGAEGGSGGTSMDKEGGFVSELGGVWDGKVQWFCGKGVESPRDCAV